MIHRVRLWLLRLHWLEWAALLLALALRLNNALYYDITYGYDYPLHLVNVTSILETRAMPPPPVSPYSYEAHQAPLVYFLVAALTRGLNAPEFFTDHLAAALFITGLIYMVVAACWVHQLLRRVPPLLRALTLLTVLVFPVQTMMFGMFGNDLPVSLFIMLCVATLWTMSRTGRLYAAEGWLWAALWGGLAAAVKLNGVIALGVYVFAAGYALAIDVRWQAWARAKRLLRITAVGLPLLIIPFSVNAWHASRYVGNPLGVLELGGTQWQFDPGVLLRFDTSIFERPLAFGPGDTSFWAMQYVTLHSDYFNHWNSPVFETYPEQAVMLTHRLFVLPVERFQAGIYLHWLALPMMALMVSAGVVALWRCARTPRRALRDGSVVTAAFLLVMQLALIAHVYGYAHVRAAHARYAGFLYGFLLAVGVEWCWRHSNKQQRWVMWLLATVPAVYSLIAIRLMWLPPV